MDIPLHARATCVDETCGETTHVIINPVSREITHVVVRESGIAGQDHLVPIGQILESAPDEIRLRCTKDQLAGMPEFKQLEYEPGTKPYLGYPAEGYLMWPYLVADVPVGVEHEQIPEGELAIQRGAQVEAADGYIGRVDQFLIDPTNNRITHLILREGPLWGKKDVTIPITDVERIEQGTVHLRLDKQAVEALPAVPARRATL